MLAGRRGGMGWVGLGWVGLGWVGGGVCLRGGIDLGFGLYEYFDCAYDLIRLTKRRLSEQGELSLRLPQGTGTVRGRQLCTCRCVAVHEDH